MEGIMRNYVFLFVFCLWNCQAQTPQAHYFFDPGIKLGYSFGEGGGFVYGVELSFVITGRDSRHPSYGITFDYDILPNGSKYHLGVEYMSPFVGLDIGPSVLSTDSSTLYGLSVIPFAGILILPYYNFTYFTPDITFHEVGTYLKVPIQMDHYTYNWRNSD